MPQIQTAMFGLALLTVWDTAGHAETVGHGDGGQATITSWASLPAEPADRAVPEAAWPQEALEAERPFDLFTTLRAMMPPSEWARPDAAVTGQAPATR